MFVNTVSLPMTQRELASGAGALLVGLLLGALVIRHCAGSPRHVHTEEAPVDAPGILPADGASPDVTDSGDADALDAEPEVPDAALLPEVVKRDAARATARDASPDAAPIVLRASNLLIHPGRNEHDCVDAPSHGRGLQLYPCHGRTNQRWTFAEDTTGASRIFGEGGCVRVTAAQVGGEPTLDVGACSGDVSRFRHRADQRLEDAQSGQCVTVRALEKHARLVLEACDASNAGQTWTFSP